MGVCTSRSAGPREVIFHIPTWVKRLKLTLVFNDEGRKQWRRVRVHTMLARCASPPLLPRANPLFLIDHQEMPVFLVVYDPTKGNEHEMTAALHRWKGARIFRGAWLVEFDSRAELALRALAKAARANISCAIVEISPNGDHAEMGAGATAWEALRRFAPTSSGP